jgi:hypothetical protein
MSPFSSLGLYAQQKHVRQAVSSATASPEVGPRKVPGSQRERGRTRGPETTHTVYAAHRLHITLASCMLSVNFSIMAPSKIPPALSAGGGRREAFEPPCLPASSRAPTPSFFVALPPMLSECWRESNRRVVLLLQAANSGRRSAFARNPRVHNRISAL